MALISDGYIERLSEQTFVSAIGNRLAIAFQKMIRITVAEGLKRMYKEYRLKQWQMLLDKAALLRRVLEQREREENQQGQINSLPPAENVPTGTSDLPQAANNRLQPSVRANDLRGHETQHDWQRAAPEAYDWHPVTDYRPRTNSTTDSARNCDRFPTMVSLSVEQDREVSEINSVMDFETSESSVTSSQDYSIPQTVTGSEHSQTVTGSERSQTVPSNQSTISRLHPDISEMVEAMEAIFHDTDDEVSPDEDQPQPDSDQPSEDSLSPPIPRPQWNMAMTSSPARIVNDEINSPAGNGRALEGINQAGMLGEIMNESSPSRRRLLWRDDPPPPTPADRPVLLMVSSGMTNDAPYVHPSLNLRADDEGRLVPTNNEETAPEPNQQAQIDAEQPGDQDDLDSSLQSYVSWDSGEDSNDIDALGGILYAAERLGPMDQSMHMDIEMGDMGLGHLLFDRAAGTWATSHCEFHRVN